MAKKTSEFVSAIGVLVSIITALVAAVKKHGGSDEDIHRLATPEGESLVDQLGRMIAEAGQKVANAFRLLVNYDQSLADAIAAGKYDSVKDNITKKNFPPQRSGTAEVEIHLIHFFNKRMSTEDALEELDRMGLRPAELPELLALGSANPALQREFPVVALGSVWQSLIGFHYCPGLWGSASGRGLGLGWLEGGWHGGCRFAALRK